jgi:hypothetical protein
MEAVGLSLATSHKDAESIGAVNAAQSTQTDALQDVAEEVFVDISVGDDGSQARDHLVRFATEILIPTLEAESVTYLSAAQADPELALLVEAMRTEQDAIIQLVDDLLEAQYPGEITAATGGLWSLYTSYGAKLATYVFPRLAADPSISLTDLFAEQQKTSALDEEGKLPGPAHQPPA